MIFLGIDIGLQGGVARLDDSGELIGVDDMPVLNDGPAGRRAINAPLLAALIYKSHAAEAAVGAFAFGRSRGVIEGVLGAAGIPATMITPVAWKRSIGLTLASKDAARSEAIRRWPNHAALFARVKDDGRAEAALIAVAGLLRRPRP
jgi:crossover junction endodeoxyribonuclease RuvC